VIKGIFLKYKTELIGIMAGGLLGFLYYYFIGCETGTCMISSNPFISVPYGSLLGFFSAGLFKKNK
jgi:hypothetical protein